MKTADIILPDDARILQKMLLSERHLSAQKDEKILHLKQQYQQLLEQMALARHQQYGKSSEVSPDQLALFNEAEMEDNVAIEECDTKTATPLKCTSQRKPKRKPLPKDLPRDIIIHDIPDADKVCDSCGHERHKIGEDKSEQLEFIPAQLKVIEHIRPKYGCRHCEQQGLNVDIKIAPVPLSPIPKSMATASLLSQIITNKYQYALPLYRQESLFGSHGIELSRQTMSYWLLAVTPLLMPVIEHLHDLQLQQTVIHADETPLQVINEDKNTCYMWVYCTGTDSPQANKLNTHPPNIVRYDYQNSRSGQCAQNYLRAYQGYLQVDGYAGYGQTQATLVGCWAHARRKFIEAQKVQVKGKTGKADWAINHIKKLYRIEAGLVDKSTIEKRSVRQAQSAPLLKQLNVWLVKSAQQVVPKSAIGKAVRYSLRQWPKLIRYIESGELAIDNNRAERAVKPFVIGRKNWMFSNTAKGANSSAVLYSLIETAKANGVDPMAYLNYLFEELPKKPKDINKLMPWNVALTEKQ